MCMGKSNNGFVYPTEYYCILHGRIKDKNSTVYKMSTVLYKNSIVVNKYSTVAYSNKPINILYLACTWILITSHIDLQSFLLHWNDRRLSHSCVFIIMQHAFTIIQFLMHSFLYSWGNKGSLTIALIGLYASRSDSIATTNLPYSKW